MHKSRVFLGLDFNSNGQIFEGLRVQNIFAFGRRIDPDRTYYKGYLNKEGQKKNDGETYHENGDIVRNDD